MKRKSNFWKGVLCILYGAGVAAVGMYISNGDPSQELALAGLVCIFGSFAFVMAGAFYIVIPHRRGD